MPIVVNLDVMLARRKMSLTGLSERVGITILEYLSEAEYQKLL